MTIKIGDKVRIKTEEELLAEGWTKSYSFWQKDCHNIHERHCGKVFFVKEIFEEGIGIVADCGDYQVGLPILTVSEILPQTLDEYICNLPLEERAEKFIVHLVGFGTLPYYSSITKSGYLTYDEALQATIGALKQPKE